MSLIFVHFPFRSGEIRGAVEKDSVDASREDRRGAAHDVQEDASNPLTMPALGQISGSFPIATRATRKRRILGDAGLIPSLVERTPRLPGR
jgi:hypothetical protein